MPIRNRDIFEDFPAKLNPDVNPWVAQLIEGRKNNSLPAFYGPWLRDKKGRWKEVFVENGFSPDKPVKIVLEVGVHKGKTLIEMAEAFPDYGFVGLDITFKRVVSTALKAKERKLNNIISVLADARYMDHLFADEELAGTLVFFPDPWLKKKSQRHNRLLNEAFIEGLRRFIKDDGFFWFKTDARDYFDEVSEILNKHQFVSDQLPDPLLTGEYQSVFELMFEGKELPTHSGAWRKL